MNINNETEVLIDKIVQGERPGISYHFVVTRKMLNDVVASISDDLKQRVKEDISQPAVHPDNGDSGASRWPDYGNELLKHFDKYDPYLKFGVGGDLLNLTVSSIMEI